MRARKHSMLVESIFWFGLFFVALAFSLTNHAGLGVLSVSVLSLLIILNSISEYKEGEKTGNVISLPVILFLTLFKFIIAISIIFTLGDYPGKQIISLVAAVLVWVYVALAIKKRKPKEIAFAILVLQCVIVSSYYYL